jgi:hypothetical protein
MAAGMASPFGDDAVCTMPLGLSETEFAALLRTLRFRHFKWDAYACGACPLLP